MLALSPPSASTKTLTPNLLPCTIQHSGPLSIPPRYWDPQPVQQPTDYETTQAAASFAQEHHQEEVVYLRGRKLLSRRIKLPAGYTGVLAQKTDKTLPQPTPPARRGHEVEHEAAEEEDGEQPVDVKVLERTARFNEIAVWGHEAAPERDEDPYVRGIEEWMGFAQAVSLKMEFRGLTRPGKRTD